MILALLGALPNVPAQTRPDFVPADARFMRGMILHHAQAVTMAALVPERTERRELVALAERIAVAQTVEIRMMGRWLRDRGEPLSETGHDEHDRMPGMLTAAGLTELAGRRGARSSSCFSSR